MPIIGYGLFLGPNFDWFKFPKCMYFLYCSFQDVSILIKHYSWGQSQVFLITDAYHAHNFFCCCFSFFVLFVFWGGSTDSPGFIIYSLILRSETLSKLKVSVITGRKSLNF